LRTIAAKDMREALTTVRAEMGENAVIVDSVRARDGSVIVRAALGERAGTSVSASALAADRDADEHQVAQDMPLSFEDAHRALLARRLRGEGPGTAKPLRRFSRAELLAILRGHRAPEALTHELAKAAEQSGLSDMTLALASALDRNMKVAPIDLAKQSALLVIGPNGAGKTAVAAKLAAQARLAHRAVRLIATDCDGAGAFFRLETLAKHIGVPCEAAENSQILSTKVEDSLKENVVSIIDTAGFDPRNAKMRSAFAALSQITGVDPVGVLSALTDAEEILEMAAAISVLGAKSMVVTGVDLVRRLGALAAVAAAPVALTHVTRSPYVAAGLETPTPLSLAQALTEGSTRKYVAAVNQT